MANNSTTSNIFVDIRSSDEVMTKRFDGSKMTNYYNIPSNMIRFNQQVIINHLQYVDTIYLVCSTSRRSQFIKDKYFPHNNRIKVDKQLQFSNFPNNHGKLNITLDNGKVEQVWITGTFNYNLYNLTRIIQILLGLIMFICGLLLWNKKKISIAIKVMLLLFGLMALFNGLTNTCTISVLFRNLLN